MCCMLGKCSELLKDWLGEHVLSGGQALPESNPCYFFLFTRSWLVIDILIRCIRFFLCLLCVKGRSGKMVTEI